MPVPNNLHLLGTSLHTKTIFCWMTTVRCQCGACVDVCPRQIELATCKLFKRIPLRKFWVAKCGVHLLLVSQAQEPSSKPETLMSDVHLQQSWRAWLGTRTKQIQNSDELVRLSRILNCLNTFLLPLTTHKIFVQHMHTLLVVSKCTVSSFVPTHHCWQWS